MFDDDIDFNTHKNNLMMTSLYTLGRNKGMTVWFSTQSMFAVNPNARDNIDRVFLRKIRTSAMMEKVIREFLIDIVPTPESCNTIGKKISYLSRWVR